jgi:DNA-binding SARP family transcriptional activator
MWMDVDQFEKAIRFAKNQPEHLVNIINLYQGDFLPDTPYETWAAEARERFATQFLEAADRLADYWMEQKRFQDVIDLCLKVLMQDNCWERAYQRLMIAYDRMGDRGQVGRTYQRCVQTLRQELDVHPAPVTEQLYLRLVQTVNHYSDPQAT